jgi:hypothetical protein
VLGPRIPCLGNAQSGGKVEFDFQGTFLTENKGSVLLRHAYWEVKDEQFRLLAGQTWDVISPLMPNTLMYSVYWGAGNIGYRRAQFRGERYITLSDTCLWTVQGSLNTDVVSEFPMSTTVPAPPSGDQASWPVLEGRTAITLGERGKGGRPVTLGISGHVGEQIFDFPAAPPLPAVDNMSFRTWSFNVDLRAPITDRLGFMGEYYIGDNLGAYLGGIVQGIDPGLRVPIYDTGGWMEVWYDWTPSWHSNVGYCIDQPNRNDLSSASERTYNAVYFGNVIYDVTKQFQVGLEVGSWRTLYVGKTPGESIRTEFMARYGF